MLLECVSVCVYYTLPTLAVQRRQHLSSGCSSSVSTLYELSHSAAEHYDCTHSSIQNQVLMGTGIEKILSEKESLGGSYAHKDQVKQAGIDRRAAVVKNEENLFYQMDVRRKTQLKCVCTVNYLVFRGTDEWFHKKENNPVISSSLDNMCYLKQRRKNKACSSIKFLWQLKCACGKTTRGSVRMSICLHVWKWRVRQDVAAALSFP